jgi:hypothetical protein
MDLSAPLLLTAGAFHTVQLSSIGVVSVSFRGCILQDLTANVGHDNFVYSGHSFIPSFCRLEHDHPIFRQGLDLRRARGLRPQLRRQPDTEPVGIGVHSGQRTSVVVVVVV